MDKKIALNRGAWIGIGVRLSLLVFLLILSIGLTAFRIDISRIQTWEFWVSVSINAIVVIVSFNVIRELVIDSHKKSNQIYIYVVTQYSRIVDFIFSNKLMLEVKKLVGDENIYRKELAEEKALNRITSVFTLKDIKTVTEKSTEEIIKKAKLYELSKKEIRELLRIIKQIKNGKISFASIHQNDLLEDNENDKDKDNLTKIKINAGKITLWENFKKTAVWLLLVVLLAIIERQTINTGIFTLFIEKGTLILGSSASAWVSGAAYITLRRRILNNRCVMLSRLEEVDFLEK